MCSAAFCLAGTVDILAILVSTNYRRQEHLPAWVRLVPAACIPSTTRSLVIYYGNYEAMGLQEKVSNSEIKTLCNRRFST
ncbi:hypothetical protein KCU81_g705, partial [Aureobasidium melanogenum]